MSYKRLLLCIDVVNLMADLELLNTLNKDNDNRILFKQACVVGKEMHNKIPCCMCIIEIGNTEESMLQLLRNHTFEVLSDYDTEIFNIISELDVEWYDINSTTISRCVAKALLYDTLCKDTYESSDDVHIFDDYCSKVKCANGVTLEILDRYLVSDDEAIAKVIAHNDDMPIALNMSIKVVDILGMIVEDNMNIIYDMLKSINTMCADRISLLNMMFTQKYKEVFINTDITK